MLTSFYPKKYVESAYGIPYERYFKKGFRGVIFDIDNTLVPPDAPADHRAMELFARLEALGMGTYLMSNNKEPRVASFASQVGAGYLHKSRKPLVKGYKKAMEQLGTDEKTTLFVGDQLFTDIWGANRAGIYSILVKPMDPREEVLILAKRYLEALVLRFDKRRRCR